MGNKLCIYHGNCADGFGAAWVMRQTHPSAEFFAGVYSEPAPDCTGRDVYFLDFCYKSSVMAYVYETCKSLTILDHHKSAMDDCSWLLQKSKTFGTFDMEKSGVMLSWEYFNPGADAPRLIHHIQDRDLWRFNLRGTHEIQSTLFSYPYDFEIWSDLMALSPESLISDGEAIARKQQKDIAEFRAGLERRMTIGGYEVPVMNVPYTFVSEAAGAMAVDEPFAACYWDSAKVRTFGLRSSEVGVDVSEIAKQYGGGGHIRASGFSVPRTHELARG